MSFKYTITSFRSDTAIPFWEFPVEIQEYINTTYKNTGEFQDRTIIISEDEYVQTINATWTSKSAWEPFRADPILIPMWSARHQYNTRHDILFFWQEQV